MGLVCMVVSVILLLANPFFTLRGLFKAGAEGAKDSQLLTPMVLCSLCCLNLIPFSYQV